MSEGAASSGAPAGWYPTDDGQRYWDGTAWTSHIAPSGQPTSSLPAPAPGSPTGSLSDNDLALFCHIGGAFFSFLVPLVIYLIKKDESPYVRHHAAQALNFQITICVAFVISVVLMLILIGFLLFFAVIVASMVLAVLASIAANKGEWYRYPLAIPLFS